MYNYTGYLRTCLLLLLVGLLALPWQSATARWSDPPPVGGAPLAEEHLADIVHLRPYLPTGQAVLASSVVSGDQGPHLWRPLKTRLVPRVMLQPLKEETKLPDRLAVTCTVSSTSDSGPNTLRQCLLDAITGDDILFNPSESMLRAEARGRVTIYDSLDSEVVDRALDEQFSRIENMMFVGIRHTLPDGSVEADDDCDS